MPEVPKRPEPEEIAFEEEVVTEAEEYLEEEEYLHEEEEYIHEEEEYLHEEEEVVTEEVVPVIPVKGRLHLLQSDTAASLESGSLILSDSGIY